MQFNQLKHGDKVYILEVVGTFLKCISYNIGTVTQVGTPYDEPLPQGQFPIPGQVRRKLVDITIQSYGESKKLAVQADKSSICDSSIGLTLSTDLEDVRLRVLSNLENAIDRKESVKRYDEEIRNCLEILERIQSNTGQA